MLCSTHWKTWFPSGGKHQWRIIVYGSKRLGSHLIIGRLNSWVLYLRKSREGHFGEARAHILCLCHRIKVRLDINIAGVFLFIHVLHLCKNIFLYAVIHGWKDFHFAVGSLHLHCLQSWNFKMLVHYISKHLARACLHLVDTSMFWLSQNWWHLEASFICM